MDDSLGAHAPVLAEARSLLLQKDYDAARAVLKDLVRRDPECTEAVHLLLSVDEAQQRQRIAERDEGEDSLLRTGGLSFKSGREIRALLGGAIFLALGLWYLFQFAKVGIDGQFPMTRTSGRTRMVSGKTALLYGLGFTIPGALSFVYGLSRLRLK